MVKKMETLLFEQVTEQVETCAFDCGVDSINKYVKDSYFPMIAQHAYAYSIYAKGILLGYYQIMLREIELEDFPEDISEVDPGVKEEKLSSLHIRFIALDKKYQKKKLGTQILRAIIKNIKDLSDLCPIRVITIDAKTNLVHWYKREGFINMKKNTAGQDGFTEAMYFDCIRFSDELNEYMDKRSEV